MRVGILITLAAMLACTNATPTQSPSATTVAPATPNESLGLTLLDDAGYLAAWGDVLGGLPESANMKSNALRTVKPIDGHNSYVAYFYRKGRFYISLVAVLPSAFGP